MNKNGSESKEGDEYWIGFDLGGTKMLSVVFDRDFNIVGKSRKKTKGNEGMESGLKRINNTIEESIEEAKLAPKDIKGLGIGCPGPLDFEKGVIVEAPNLGWDKIPIRKSIEDKFGFHAEIANDVDAGVFGEYEFGAGQKARCVVGIFPGTGIGGGCVYEGRLLRGKNMSCMEIGHIPMLPGGSLDGAGNPGSLESVASRLSIAGQAAQAVYRGGAPKLMKHAGTDIASIRSGALSQAVEGGDEAIKNILLDACTYLGLGVVTIVHLLAPDVIVFGGGLIEAMPKLMLNQIEKVAKPR
ncbi:MAG: ROK family protein, partial [Planctomycetota bacterium]